MNIVSISCRIRIKGRLDDSWSEKLNGLHIRSLEGSDAAETVLEGDVPDQSALMGVLSTLGDLNLAIISVDTMDRDSTDRDQKSA
jgi:hypothetical protein